jgi:hypothetical protein
MGRRTWVAVSGVLLAAAAVFALHGLFAISYNGDRESGATYVLVAGHRIDADIVGAIALLLALATLRAATLLLRRR